MKFIYSTVIALSILSLSCDNSEGDEIIEPVDSEKPVLTMTSPGEAPYFTKAISIEASATDNVNVKSISIFIDDNLLKKVDGSNINETWDSKTLADGVHTIKIVATDDSGNEALQSTQVNVLNYFIKVNLDFSLDEGRDYWYYISDHEGSLVSVKQATEQGQLMFETPEGFELDDTFMLTEFIHFKDLVNWNNYFTYVAEARTGIYSIRKRTFGTTPSVEPVGTHVVKVNNVSSITNSLVRTNAVSYDYSEQTNSWQLNLELLDPDAEAYIALWGNGLEVPHFKSLSGLALGETTDVDYSTFSPMTGVSFPSFQMAINTNSFVYGISGDYETFDKVWEQTNNMSKFSFFFPGGDAYDEYLFTGTAYENGAVHIDSKADNQAPTEIRQLEANVSNYSFTDHQVHVETTGSYDLLEVYGSVYFNTTLAHVDHWNLLIPANSSIDVKIPDVPQEIADKYTGKMSRTEDVVFNTIEFKEFSGFDGYYEYLDWLYATDDHYLKHSSSFTAKRILTNDVNNGGAKF